MLKHENLLNVIKDNIRVIEFKKLEKIVNEDKTLKENLKALFELQQEIVQLKHIGKYKILAVKEQTYKTLRKTLEENPLIQQYLELQEEVNYMLIEVSGILEEAIKL